MNKGLGTCTAVAMVATSSLLAATFPGKLSAEPCSRWEAVASSTVGGKRVLLIVDEWGAVDEDEPTRHLPATVAEQGALAEGVAKDLPRLNYQPISLGRDNWTLMCAPGIQTEFKLEDLSEDFVFEMMQVVLPKLAIRYKSVAFHLEEDSGAHPRLMTCLLAPATKDFIDSCPECKTPGSPASEPPSTPKVAQCDGVMAYDLINDPRVLVVVEALGLSSTWSGRFPSSKSDKEWLAAKVARAVLGPHRSEPFNDAQPVSLGKDNWTVAHVHNDQTQFQMDESYVYRLIRNALNLDIGAQNAMHLRVIEPFPACMTLLDVWLLPPVEGAVESRAGCEPIESRGAFTSCEPTVITVPTLPEVPPLAEP